MARAIHYSGGIRAPVGKWFTIRLEGWPACMSGAGERCPMSCLSKDAGAVTCERCRKLIEAQRAYQEAQAHA